MKMIYNGAPIKSLNVKHYEMSTQDATLRASDMQAGITAYAKGRKVIGTGKSFEFASYGEIDTNIPLFSPSIINVVEIASISYPIKLSIELRNMKDTDFLAVQTIGHALIDGVEYPITIQVNGVILTFACEKTIKLQYFCGKDNYV